MYIGTGKVFGQGVALGEEPDPQALRVQRELEERVTQGKWVSLKPMSRSYKAGRSK